MKIKANLFNKRIPTVLGVMVLIGGLVAGILLVSKPQSLLTKAGPTSVPKNVKISNKGAESVAVSWTTDVPVTGLLRYSDNPSNLSLPGADTRDQMSGTAGVFTTHYVVLTNLKASTTYYFEIVTGSASYSDNNKPYQVRTGVITNSGAEDIISGKVLSVDGQGLEGAVVYVEIDGGETLSALTKNGGMWQLNLGEVKDSKGQVLAYDRQNQQVSLFVQGGVLGTATALTNTASDSPVMDIVMGTNVNLVATTDLTSGEPASNAVTPEEISSGAGFGGLADGVVATETEELLNPMAEGEKIATSSPEFRGKLPAGTNLKITVNSQTEQSVDLTVGEDGAWVWTPPLGLEPGEHTISIEYQDQGGVLQTITRSFVVLAAEEAAGLPSFTATGSAEPTAVPTVIEASGSSMPSTESGVPEAGVLTSTYWLLIVGLGLFFTGQLSRKWIQTK
jgi:hypothetical protein